jgi:steroid delta-isomerase-like uncharacterized protein
MGGTNADTLRDFVQAFNDRDFDRAAQLVGDDVVFVDVAGGETYNGPDGIVDLFKKWSGGFPDIQVETLALVADEQGAAGEFVGRGTHDGTLVTREGDIPPTNRPLEERFILIAEIEGGKITGAREYYNAMSIMMQLGLMPEAAEAP